jgi:hypothetical protein
MNTKKATSELKDLEVDRVDGVDKPATGRNFLFMKDEGGASAVLKGYGMLATVSAEVLSKMRTDKHAKVSRKSAIALNGLAQVLGQDAVFVGKSVPTQPYEFSEPDADKRGPADENLGGNFTPRSMPGSMIGSVQFRMKDEDEDDEEDEDDAKAKSKAKAMYDEDEDDKKSKAKKGKAKDADADADDDDMDGSERANRGVARSLDAMAKGIEALAKSMQDLPAAIVKAEKAEIAKMAGGEDEPAEPVKKAAKSRQIVDDEPVSVRKGQGGYESRFGVGFGNVVFGGK